MFTASGSARIAYDITDEPSATGGRDVLLIHAGVTDRRSWTAVVDALAPQHRCISYDARGFGETTYERQDGWSPVDDAIAILDAAAADRVVVVAGSMGGRTAIDLALANPERVEALVLIGTAVRGAPYPDPTEGPTATLGARIEEAEESEDWTEVNRLEAWMWLDGPAASEGRVSGPARELFLDMNGKALRAVDPGDQAEVEDAWPRIDQLAMPTLVMIGRLDAEDIVFVDEELAPRLPRGRLVWLDGVAHLPQLEGDPTTLEEIRAFVAGL